MPYKIYIDTTDRLNKLVRLLDDTNTILFEETGDMDVATKIKEITIKYNLDLTGDAVTIEANPGPGMGSFTGIKVGIVIENIINWVSGKKTIKELTKPDYGKDPNISVRKKA